jgi:putative addiction module component (TIGR02574 family)
MTAQQTSRMPIAQRLQTMEALWDSLGAARSTLPSPAWHRAILDERRKKIADGKAKFLTLDQVRAKLAR